MDDIVFKTADIKQLFTQMAHGELKPCDFFDTCSDCPFYVKSNLPLKEPCEYSFYNCPKLDNV